MGSEKSRSQALPRRDFFKVSGATTVALAAGTGCMYRDVLPPKERRKRPAGRARADRSSTPGVFAGERLNRVAFPLGGIGAGMICLEGTGALSHVSLRNRPEIFNEPSAFAALCVKGPRNEARVLEAPVPGWKVFGQPNTGNGAPGATYGLPRFSSAVFTTRFPFAVIELTHEDVPVRVEITGWSPFEPGDPDNSSLPVAALEYKFTNGASTKIDAVFSFNTKNFVAVGHDGHGIRSVRGGFVLWEAGEKGKPWEQCSFAVTTPDPAAKVNCAWFRGGWWDSLTMAWKDVEEGACYERPPVEGTSPGATLFVPFSLQAGASKTVVLQLAWFSGISDLRRGRDPKKAAKEAGTYKPWYAGRFADVDEVLRYWRSNYETLRNRTKRFSDCFYDSTLPPEVVEAVAANLTILKSPTVLRQADGRLWCWEGCSDSQGCCHGSCTHVWNYAQALPHLFPSLERTLRETEFFVSQDERGHQALRTALPIRPTTHDFHAAADGQLGGIMKVFREWRISGDTEWLRRLWPRVKASLDYCIEAWDPRHKGVLEEPHHNTYDIEFWGPDGMCSSFYLGALAAAVRMGEALGKDVSFYNKLYEQGVKFVESELFNGEYFIQKIQWTGLRAKDPVKFMSMGGKYSPEAIELLKKEGPKYQYGRGCLSDGVIGAWMAAVCGVGGILNSRKVRSHLVSVHKYNLKRDLSDHANPQRPTFACGTDGGLLLCTWPRGGKLSLPFVYSDEVWTGIEYQVASHLMLMGHVEEGLDIVRTCRKRYDGRVRNPFNEYECGHWYARAMSSYALLQGLTGAFYDAVEKKLTLKPSLQGDFRSFFATATGYGTVGVRGGKPFLETKSGKIEVKEIDYTARA